MQAYSGLLHGTFRFIFGTILLSTSIWVHKSQMPFVQRGRKSVSTKRTVAALSGRIANARVAPALCVAHVYPDFIGQPKIVADIASFLTALVLAGLEMCCIPVGNIRPSLICCSRVIRLAVTPCRRWRAALVQIRPPARNHLAKTKLRSDQEASHNDK